MAIRKLEGKTLIVATHNKGKVAEIADLIGPYGLEAKSAGELGLPEPEENGDTFEANAYTKAFSAASAPALKPSSI